LPRIASWIGEDPLDHPDAVLDRHTTFPDNLHMVGGDINLIGYRHVM
jgi:hypothetical protein